MAKLFSHPREDSVAGIVVFLVALPLCLGIAVACKVPPVSGLVAGIVGGLVVPLLSRAPLSVTGPAAGLTSIVLFEVARLGSIPAFLSAVVLAGLLQLAFGVLRTGRFATLVPAAVIQGMLAAIGATIVLKQIPVALGVKGELSAIATQAKAGPAVIAALSLAVLFGWAHTPMARFKQLPAALVVVVLGGVLAAAFSGHPLLGLAPEHFVSVPLGGLGDLLAELPRPDTAAFLRGDVWVAAITIAVVASIETLLSVQAVDRLDPQRRTSPPDRELVAQGVGNVVSGFLGGLPITSVIVRSGANVAAGGKDRLSAMVHGVMLLVAVLAAGALLHRIPLACLAAVLLQVGYNLCKPATFRAQARLGLTQLVPFGITVVAVLATDLLKGVIVGIVAGVVYAIHQNVKGTIDRSEDPDGTVRVRFRRDGTFLAKPALVTALASVPDGGRAVIDTSGEYVDHDMKEALAAFLADAPARNIQAHVEGLDLAGVAVSAH